MPTPKQDARLLQPPAPGEFSAAELEGLPFRAHQVLSPPHGFVWTARAAGVIAGSDRYVDGDGAMDRKLAGLVTVAHAQGPRHLPRRRRPRQRR